MIPFLHPSFESLKPKRLVFDRLPQNLQNQVGQSPEQQREQWSARLDELESQVRQGLTNQALEELETTVSREDLRQQDQRDVDRLVAKVATPNALDTQQERTAFFGHVEERLSVLLTMLRRNNQFEDEALRNNPQQLLNQLRSQTNLKIQTAAGERDLLPQERAILNLAETVPGHNDQNVRSAWTQMLQELQLNVSAMGYAASIAQAESRGERAQAPAGVSGRLREVWNTVSEGFDKLSTNQKILAGIAGALTVYGIIRLFRSESGKGKLAGLLGLGALIAGGVYVYGEYLSPSAAFERLRSRLSGLSEVNFLRGLRAFRNNDVEGARAAWGEHANTLFREFGREDLVTAGGTASNRPSTLREDIATPENREQLRYEATRNILIRFYCHNTREYSEADRTEIRGIIDDYNNSDVKVVDLYNLWKQHENQNSMPESVRNQLHRFDASIETRNIFTAMKIIGKTYEIYQAQFQTDAERNMTVAEFMRRVASDPVHEAGGAIHDALVRAAQSGDLNNFSLSSLTEYFNNAEERATESLCEKLGVDIESLSRREKIEFFAIVASISQSTNLDQNVDQAFRNISGRSESATQKARQFYERCRERTIQSIIPDVVARFNIANAQDPDKNNILRNHFIPANIPFRKAIYLNAVSVNVDFNNRTEARHHVVELSLLFVAMSCLPESQGNYYKGELFYQIVNAPSNLQVPGLQALSPYFETLKEVLRGYVSRQASRAQEILNPWLADQTPEQRAAFLEQMRNADAIEFGLGAGREGVRGSIQIAKEFLWPLIESGRVTYEDLQSADGVDIVNLLTRIGAIFIYPKEEGEHGMIYAAGQYFLFRPLGIVRDTFVALARGREGEEGAASHAQAGIQVYAAATAPYVMIGAASGALRAKGHIGWRAFGMLRGATRGFAAPVTMPLELYRAGQRGAEVARQIATRGTLKNLMRNMSMIDFYGERIPSDIDFTELFSRRELSRRLFNTHWNASRYNRFVRNFRRSYNSFFGFSEGAEGYLRVRRAHFAVDAEEVVRAGRRLRNFTNALAAHPNYVGAQAADELIALLDDIARTHELTGPELNALRAKVRADGGAALRNSIDDVVRYIGRARAGAEVVDEAVRLRRGMEFAAELPPANTRVSSMLDMLETIRAGGNLDDAALANLRQLARTEETAGEVVEALRRFGIAGDKVDEVMDALKAEGSFDDLVQAFARAEIPTNSRLRSALNIIRRGGELSLDALRALRTALAGLPETRVYQAVVRALRSLPGATSQTVEAAVAALRSEGRMTNLLSRLRATRLFTFNRGVTAVAEVGGAVDEALDISRAVSSASDTLRALKEGRQVTRAQLEFLDLAIRTGNGADDVRQVLRGLDVADDQIEAFMTSFRAAESEADLTRALQQAGLRPVISAAAEGAEVAGAIPHLDDALEVLRSGGEINRRHLLALRQASQGDDFAGVLRNAGVADEHIGDVVRVFSEQDEVSRLAQAIEGSRFARVSRGLKGLARVARFMRAVPVVGGAIAGAGLGAIESYQAFAIAEEYKNNEQFREVMEDKGWFNAAAAGGMLALDVGAIAGAISAGPAAIILVGAMAIMYMVNGALEAEAEAARGYDIWKNEALKEAFQAAGIRVPEGQELNAEQAERLSTEARNILIHHWFTTGSDLSLGEAYGAYLVHLSDEEFFDTNRELTREKLVKALIELESPGKSADYKLYQYKYILAQRELLTAYGFRDAESLLVKSKMFADLMSDRTKTISMGQPPTEVQLSDMRFNAANISQRDIDHIFAVRNREVNNGIKELLGEQVFDRLEWLYRRDPNYLNYAANTLMAHVSSQFESMPRTEFQRYTGIAIHIQLFLKMKGYRYTIDTTQPSEEDLEEVMSMLANEEMTNDQVIDKMGPYRQTSRGVAAFYTLARYFGYTGTPNILSIRNFLTEARAERFGVYWDPEDEEWTVNVEYGVDRDADEWQWNPNTTDEEARFVISLLKEHKTNIFRSRFDAAFDFLAVRQGTRDDEILRENQAWELATFMESAFEGVREQDIVERGSDHTQSETGAFVDSLTDDASSGFTTMGEALEGNTTGLEMAGEQAVEEIRQIPSRVSNYVSAVAENGIDWDRTLSPSRWLE